VTAAPIFVVSPSEAARDTLSSIQDFLSSLSVAEWVFLAIAGGLAAWVVLAARAATRLGPIEVEDVDHDGASDEAVHARTSLLRERIADAGLLPPPGVPGGAPKSDLLAAVEKSPIPQANWIATLLRLVPWPKPTHYYLATTLLTDGASRGARIWLRSSSDAAPLLTTLDAPTVDEGLDRVPAVVFARVSTDAVYAFPIWARWDDESRLRVYLRGMAAQRHGDLAGAKAAFAHAAALQPTNVLVRLRLANLREAKAADTPLAGQRAIAEAGVLRLYLDLAIERPELVEARYRASVLGARVLKNLDTLPTQDRIRICSALRVPNTPLDELPRVIREIAGRELDYARWLVEPWFVALVWRRLRYLVEPKGYDRRRLKRTFGLAEHCQFARNLPTDNNNLWIRLQIAWHTFLVQLAASRPTAGWQTYYNAASYFAILLEREEEMGI
jgi:hypothetical protein